MNYQRIESGAKKPKCASCHRSILRGEIGVFQKLGPQHPITDRVIWWHATCVAELIETCPPDQRRTYRYQQDFMALRDRIATAGVAFPD